MTNNDRDLQAAQHRLEQKRRNLNIDAEPTLLGDVLGVDVVGPSLCYTRDTYPQETQETQDTQETQEIKDTERKTTSCIFNATSLGDAPQLEQPLAKYILKTAEDAQLKLENYEHGDPWRTPLWDFIHLLKRHLELANLTATEAMGHIEPVLVQYAQQEGLLEDPTDPFEVFGNNWDCGSRLEFLTTWSKVRYAPDWSPLHYAEEQAKKSPFTPSICRDGKMPDYARFVSFAGWLQVGVGNRPILLPCEKLSTINLFDTNKMQISRLRQLAITDGCLVVVKEHKFRSKGKSEATEFRFNVAVDPMFLKEADDGCAEAFEKLNRETTRSENKGS